MAISDTEFSFGVKEDKEVVGQLNQHAELDFNKRRLQIDRPYVPKINLNLLRKGLLSAPSLVNNQRVYPK
jgi:hypothetical protein